MLTIKFRCAAAKGLFACLVAVSACLSVMGVILPGNVSYGDIFSAASWGGGGLCELSRQLQQSPQREEYVARLATTVGNYWASNDDPATASDASDDFSFTLIGFGKDEENTGSPEVGTLDSFSRDCLSCHDGLRASDITVVYRNSPENPRRGRHVSGKDHPVGMDYENYVASGRGNYKPIATLNSRMMLIDGKVGCLTCHNPLNPEKNHLVMSDFRSALCLSCHNK